MGAVVGVAASAPLWVCLPSSGRAVAVPSAGAVVGGAVVAIVRVVARQALCGVVRVAAVLSAGAVVGVVEGAVVGMVVGVVLERVIGAAVDVCVYADSGTARD